MPHYPEIFTNQITFNDPVRLFIGRKAWTVHPPAKFVMHRAAYAAVSPETGSVEAMVPSPTEDTYSFFIGDVARFETRPSGSRRPSVVIRKPVRGGPVEIHLTKKYTTELPQH